jgi:hypothetical protein
MGQRESNIEYHLSLFWEKVEILTRNNEQKKERQKEEGRGEWGGVQGPEGKKVHYPGSADPKRTLEFSTRKRKLNHTARV